MTDLDLDLRLEEIAERDGRYSTQAYRFVFDALDYILLQLGKSRSLPGERHVSVPQLLDGIRIYALKRFGPLSRMVFEYWGIYSTADFGEVVFNLVEGGLLNKQESDHKEDFENGFDFHETFEEGYVPEIPW